MASGSHQDWRLRFTAVSGSYIAISEIEMRASVGGSNLCTGGAVTASSSYSAGTLPGLAFDGNGSTFWESAAGAGPHWIRYSFASAVSLGEIYIRPGPYATEVPLLTWLEYSDDGGSTWVQEWSDELSGVWAVNTPRTFPIYGSGSGERFYRWEFTAIAGGLVVEAAEIELLSGGADQCSGGIGRSSPLSVGIFATYGVPNAFDNDTATETSISFASGCYIEYEFASAPTFDSYSLRAPSSGNDVASSWVLKSSPDRLNWTTVHTVTAEPTWGISERRVYLLAAVPVRAGDFFLVM